jgi:hypothetical protein
MEVRYSIYRASDDMPIFINGTIKQCAEAAGISVHTFKSYATRQRKHQKKSGSRKWEIVRDEKE